jgi:hypothetical protein
MNSLEQNFSGALTTWRGVYFKTPRHSSFELPFFLEIHLTELQKTLDAQGIELVDNQKESVLGRKALADKTKGFNLFLLSDSQRLNFIPRVQEDLGRREAECIQGFAQRYVGLSPPFTSLINIFSSLPNRN